MQRALVLYRALAKKQAVLRLTKVFGLFNRDSKCISINSPNKIRYLKNNSIKLFCVNDDSRATDADRKVFKSFFENKFSEKSIYEE